MSNLLDIVPPPIITNRHSCSSKEINPLKDFLKIRAPHLLQFIEAGAVVSKGTIKSRDELAKTYTQWYNLGGIRSRNECKTKFFCVNQIVSTLKKTGGNTEGNLELIQKYYQEIAESKFRYTITLFEKNDEVYISDGNHSSVAFFEYFSDRDLEEINIDVFIVTDNTILRIFFIKCSNFILYTLKTRRISLPPWSICESGYVLKNKLSRSLARVSNAFKSPKLCSRCIKKK